MQPANAFSVTPAGVVNKLKPRDIFLVNLHGPRDFIVRLIITTADIILILDLIF